MVTSTPRASTLISSARHQLIHTANGSDDSLRLQPSSVTRYPTLAGLLAPEDSDDSQEQRQVAEEQVYEWLRVRMTQRQQENGKKAGECPLMEEKMGKICVQTLLPLLQHHMHLPL